MGDDDPVYVWQVTYEKKGKGLTFASRRTVYVTAKSSEHVLEFFHKSGTKQDIEVVELSRLHEITAFCPAP